MSRALPPEAEFITRALLACTRDRWADLATHLATHADADYPAPLRELVRLARSALNDRVARHPLSQALVLYGEARMAELRRAQRHLLPPARAFALPARGPTAPGLSQAGGFLFQSLPVGDR